MDQFFNESAHGLSGGEAASQRSKTRDSLFLVAGFRLSGKTKVEQVRVRNLSAGGVMAELPNRVEAGTLVDVELRGIGWVKGRVAWWTAGRVGVAFDEIIDPMAARKPVGGGATTPVFTKPILPVF